MKLFIDSAHLSEIEEAYSWGVIEGVTTNPTLLREALGDVKKKGKKMDLETYLSKLLSVAYSTPVSLEVTKTSAEEMIDEGRALFQKFNTVASNVYIKVPINTSKNGKQKNAEGVKAIKTLAQEGIPVNATLIFTPEQALMAAKAGARIVSLFAGRVDDFLRTQHGIAYEKADYFPEEGVDHHGTRMHDNGIVSGVDLVRQTALLFAKHSIKAQILAASIRNPRQLREMALAGAHIATAPFAVLEQSLVHKKTSEGMEKFLDDVPAEYAKLAKDRR